MNPRFASREYSLKPDRHGDLKQSPYLVSIFPDRYKNAAGKYAIPPFQITLPAKGRVEVPLQFPPDALYRQLYFRFDVTDLTTSEGPNTYYSVPLTDIKIFLAIRSDKNRPH